MVKWRVYIEFVYSPFSFIPFYVPIAAFFVETKIHSYASATAAVVVIVFFCFPLLVRHQH